MIASAVSTEIAETTTLGLFVCVSEIETGRDVLGRRVVLLRAASNGDEQVRKQLDLRSNDCILVDNSIVVVGSFVVKLGLRVRIYLITQPPLKVGDVGDVED